MAVVTRQMQLCDVVRFSSGKAIKPGGEGRYPVYGSNGIIGGCDEFRYQNGVIIGRVCAYCGSVMYCPKKFWASDNTLVTFPLNENFDTKYLFYLLTDAKLSRYAGGAAQPLVTQTVLKQVEVTVPPLAAQQRIAGILSAYDELIENSQRRIQILETMARNLYREWFIHFRFPGSGREAGNEPSPGSASHPLPEVEGVNGIIPDGWEVKKLGNIAKVNRAQINARTAPDELHYIDISSVSPGQIDTLTTYAFADAPSRARRIVQHGDMIWSCVRPNRRSFAQVMHPEPNTIASTGFAVITATEVPFTFIYFATTTDDFVSYLTNHATGAAYPAVSAATFKQAELLIPPDPLLKAFGDATVPMAEQIHTLQQKIQNLRQTRDLLLPRLLSGQMKLEGGDE